LFQLSEKINQFTVVYKVALYIIFLQSFRIAVVYAARALLRSRCCHKKQDEDDPVTVV
jgi:hypothetical protein